MSLEHENQLLANGLRQLAATGTAGFEGLIQRLVTRLTGIEFYLAQSGTQSGRDMSSERRARTLLAVECKRYGSDTEFREDELKGKLVSAVDTIPGLDLWVLAASRPVSDQLYSALESAAFRLNVDVYVLSMDGDNGGTLATLCANAPDLVAEALKASAIPSWALVRSLLEDLARTDDFSRECDALRDRLTKGAGLHAARLRLHEALRVSFASESQSRSFLGQRVDVDAQQDRGLLVDRPSAWAALDHWLDAWPSHPTGLAVLGEEGDGKTWAVAAWIANRLRSAQPGPLVVWLPSHDASSSEFDVLIGEVFRKRLGGSADRWIERLRRWSSTDPATGPVVLLVLDGINERHKAGWWRPVIERLSADPWRTTIAPIVTTRPSYWPQVGGFAHLDWQRSVVLPYEDRELDVALEQRGLARKDLPHEILPIVRRPRYLDLAVQHRSAMAASGDITDARLIYEDWRDRESRRAGLASELEFQRAIMRLAERQRASQRLSPADLTDASAGIEHDALMGELQSSGLLIQHGPHWRVEPSRLALGLGLLLVDRLLDEGSNENPADTLASWLEPSPEIELKATIVEHAILHALRSPHCPTAIRSLLISQWLSMRNQDVRLGPATSAYFLLDPAAFLAAAEFVWSDAVDDDPWAEEILKDAFERFASNQTAAPHFVNAFERWMGFVLIHQEDDKDAIRDGSNRAGVAAALGCDVALGPLEQAGVRLTMVEDAGLLRLARLALAVISVSDRRLSAHALATGFLADALMERSGLAELCAWVVKTSDTDLWPLLEPEARRFVECGSTAGQKAAYRLLSSIGTASALELRNSLSQDLFPRSSLIERHKADPCTSGFAWRAEDCARCSGNDNVSVHIMAKHLAKCVKNPAFSVPPNTSARIVDLARSVDTSHVWSSTGMTEQDIAFETVERVLASCAPRQLGELVRAAARQLLERHGLPLRQLAFQLRHFRLALTETELALVRTAWEVLRELPPNEDKESGRAEHALFDLLLPGLTANRQLDCLLARHREALLYTSFADHIRPMPWSEISARLRNVRDDRDIGCILAFASAHPETVREDAAEDLVPLLERPDLLIRFLALRLIFHGGVASAGRAVARGEWRATGRDGVATKEDHWGSVVVARWSTDLSYDALRERITPAYLGRAMAARGFPPDEMRRYGDDLDETWLHCGTGPADGYPSIEVAGHPLESIELDLPRVPTSEFSRTISFRDRNSIWGGRRESPPLRDFLNGPSDSDIQSLHTRMGEVLSEQRRARNYWFAQRFGTTGLTEVVAGRPELVSRWLGEPAGLASVGSRTWLARSFYEAFCEVLLSTEPARGAGLYRWLRKEEGPVRFVDHQTGIPLLDFALFAAEDSAEVRSLWDEFLDASSCDRDLLVVAALAGDGPASSWLSARLDRDLRSVRPLQMIRAIRLDGFCSAPLLAEAPTTIASDAVEWQEEQQKRAVQNRRDGEWARQWFDRFTSAVSDDDALGAFRMFLRCVDSRYVWWRDVAAAGACDHRRSFLVSSENDIERAVQNNEEDLRTEFLGMRVAHRQVWPWL